MIPDYYYTEYKPIPNYEGWYEVNRMGDVRSVDRYVTIGKQKAFIKGKQLKSHISNMGYPYYTLAMNGKIKVMSAHRLVALTFIPNPNNYPVVNHKDENTHNSCVDNLEWCTQKYNNNYGNHNKKMSESHMGAKNLMYSKPSWNKGLPSHVRNTYWVNNGIINKRIACDLLDEYISNGWKRGML